jgi:hypothetical protein
MAVDRRSWMLMFLAAAGCADRVIAEDGERMRHDLECDISLACGGVQSEADCGEPRNPPSCVHVHQPSMTECIADLSDLADDIEDAEGEERSRLCDASRPQSCDSVYVSRCIPSHPAEGRPLVEHDLMVLPAIDPVDVLARSQAAEPERRAGEHWLEAARIEAASVTAFERLAAELERVGAPGDLVARAREAAREEAEHARLCIGLARDLLGVEVALGPMPIAAMRGEVSVVRLAVESAIEGCIGEAISAARAYEAAQRCTGEVSRVLAAIADDELRHAALAWAIVGWALRSIRRAPRPSPLPSRTGVSRSRRAPVPNSTASRARPR